MNLEELENFKEINKPLQKSMEEKAFTYTPITECEGKTIKKVDESWDQVGISFTDNSFIFITGSLDHDDSPEIKDSLYAHIRQLVKIEIITQEELDFLYLCKAAKEVLKEHEKKLRENKRDYKDYLALKAKFENTPWEGEDDL